MGTHRSASRRRISDRERRAVLVRRAWQHRGSQAAKRRAHSAPTSQKRFRKGLGPQTTFWPGTNQGSARPLVYLWNPHRSEDINLVSLIFWDSMIFVYLMEDHAAFAPRVRRLREQMLKRGDRICTGALTLGEILVSPYENG